MEDIDTRSPERATGQRGAVGIANVDIPREAGGIGETSPDQELLEDLLKAIREMWETRSDRSLTQERAAGRMNLSKSAFNHLLTGDAKLVGLVHIVKLASLLDKSLDDVTKYVKQQKPTDVRSDEVRGRLSHKELAELMTTIYEVVGEEYPTSGPEIRMAWALAAFKQLDPDCRTREAIVAAVKSGIVEHAEQAKA